MHIEFEYISNTPETPNDNYFFIRHNTAQKLV
jgi:hypothetical protein